MTEFTKISEPEEKEGGSYEEMLSLAWKMLSEDEAVRLFGEDVIPVSNYSVGDSVQQEEKVEEDVPF